MQQLIYRYFLTIVLLSCTISAPAQLQDIRDEIGKIIRYETAIDFDIVPGLVIGVWDQQDTAFFTFGQGVRDDDWFEMGSLSKPVTVHLVKLAMAAQAYDLSTPFCTFLPDTLCVDRWPEITVDQILTHTAGLPRQPANLGLIETEADDPYKDYDASMLNAAVWSAKPMPGRYSYSHIGYGALAWIFNRNGGFHTMADKHNSDKGIELQWRLPDDQLTPGYGFDGKPTMPWHTNALEPALGLKSTIRGMVGFVLHQQAALASAFPRLSSTLKKELKALDKRSAYKVVDGWFLIRSGKSIVFYHNGRTGGHHASVAFMPAEQKGVVVFANGTAGSNDLSLSILTMLRRAKKQ
jgi:D-alanyl-D-alanine-carboxypeptidase/D-alanyl-D-alanine-endopeptidase